MSKRTKDLTKSTVSAKSKPTAEVKWKEMLEADENDLIVFEVREILIKNVLDICYQKEMERECVKFHVNCFHIAIKSLFEMEFFDKDPGEAKIAGNPSWMPDTPIKPSPVDSWAERQNICVERRMSFVNDISRNTSSSVQISDTEVNLGAIGTFETSEANIKPVEKKVKTDALETQVWKKSKGAFMKKKKLTETLVQNEQKDLLTVSNMTISVTSQSSKAKHLNFMDGDNSKQYIGEQSNASSLISSEASAISKNQVFTGVPAEKLPPHKNFIKYTIDDSNNGKKNKSNKLQK